MYPVEASPVPAEHQTNVWNLKCKWKRHCASLPEVFLGRLSVSASSACSLRSVQHASAFLRTLTDHKQRAAATTAAGGQPVALWSNVFPSLQLDSFRPAAASEEPASRKSCCKGGARGSPQNDIMRRCGEGDLSKEKCIVVVCVWQR